VHVHPPFEYFAEKVLRRISVIMANYKGFGNDEIVAFFQAKGYTVRQ